MTLESAPDRQELVKAFGVAATVAGAEILGVYEAPFKNVFDADSSTPSLECAAEDVVGVKQGDAVVVPSASFTGSVAGVEPDGSGMVSLKLRRG